MTETHYMPLNVGVYINRHVPKNLALLLGLCVRVK